MFWSLVLACLTSLSTVVRSECNIIENPYDRPYFAIVYHSSTLCGSALLTPVWVISDKPCAVQLGVRASKNVRAGTDPFQYRDVGRTEICKGRCNLALYQVRKPFQRSESVGYLPLPYIGESSNVVRAEYVFAVFDRPWTPNVVLGMTCDYIYLRENCWDEDSDYKRFKYLCGRYDPLEPAKNFVDMCKDPNSGGPLVYHRTLYGFLVKESCKKSQQLAFVDILENLEFLQEVTSSTLGKRSNSKNKTSSSAASLVTMALGLFAHVFRKVII